MCATPNSKDWRHGFLTCCCTCSLCSTCMYDMYRVHVRSCIRLSECCSVLGSAVQHRTACPRGVVVARLCACTCAAACCGWNQTIPQTADLLAAGLGSRLTDLSTSFREHGAAGTTPSIASCPFPVGSPSPFPAGSPTHTSLLRACCALFRPNQGEALKPTAS